MEKLYLKPWKAHWKQAFLVRYFHEYEIKHEFKKRMGYTPDLKQPKTFSEKLQWMKLHYRNPLWAECADKVAVRGFVEKALGGSEHLVPQYGVYESAGDVPFDELPDEFVLKPNHLSGAVILCRDKSKLDIAEAREKMESWLRWNYYYQNGEWQYRDIPPKIICENLLPGELLDYKFFCFHGEPKLINVIKRVNGKAVLDEFLALDFQKPLFGSILRPDVTLERPRNFDCMVELSRKLSEGFPFVRVDLYNVEGKIYFGELTFTPANGMERFEPILWDQKLGDWLELSQIPAEQII